MATLLTTYYGNTVTASSNKFRVVAELYTTQEDSSKGHYLQVKYYVEVINGQSSAFTSSFKVSWNSGTSYSLSTAGTYASKTVDIGWVNYSSSTTITADGQYTGGSGTTYKSSLSNTYAVPAKAGISIKFNANGGTNAPSTVTGTAGSISIPSTKPTRNGYTFDGWVAQSTRSGSTKDVISLEKNGTELKYFRITRVNANTFEFLAYAENLSQVKVAIWTTANNQDDLAWHTLSSGSWTRESKTYNFGKQITVSGNVKLNTYQDLVNYQAHWYGIKTSDNSQIALHCPSDPCFDIEFLEGDAYPYEFGVTLYAQWKVNKLTVKYNANGGSENSSKYYIDANGLLSYESSNANWTDTWTYNETQPNGLQDAESFGLYKDGYKFNGWCLNANGTGTILDPKDSSVRPTDITTNINNSSCTVTLYAIWKISSDQSVYITLNGTMYAKDFVINNSTYIDSSGTVYAPAFTKGSSFSIKETGITALDFITGIPTK